MADDALTADKPQAPATFSSFINKSGAGKKFAPKAARRRPAAASTGLPSTAPPTAPAAAPSSTAKLPPTTEPSSTSPPPTHHSQPGNNHVDNVSDINDYANDHVEPGPSPKRRRLDPPSRQTTPMMPVAVMLPSHDDQSLDTAPDNRTSNDRTPDDSRPRDSTLQGTTPHNLTQETTPHDLTPQDTTQEITPQDSTLPADTDAPAQQKKGRRSLPWTAVNHAQDDGGEATASVAPPAKKKRAPAKPRAKKKSTTADDAQQDEDDGQEPPPPPPPPPPPKPRKSNKDKGKQPAVDGDTDHAHTTAKPLPKPRAPRRKKAAPAEGDDTSTEPKRRGRPPREDTPSDAEDHVIDPDAICMDDLASRNIRVGKLSRREREMRKIDWDAVKQRRREEDARHISTKESQAAVDKLLEMAEPDLPPAGPRYHVVDGRIELIQDSATIDRERDADREIDLMTITEEDDLTTRITARSFMKNNKRFPNDFVLPGQGRRWTAHSTDLFYQGLRSFGTDFQMIAHMFPGMTRRSIKTKFTREERDNPDIVRDCLRGKSELASHWDHFLAASQLADDSFADADRIKLELDDEERRMRVQIDDALREKAEREKQRKLAGVADEGGEDKDAKGRKKRKQKDKGVRFADEGVEVLGDVDEDPNWGVE